MGLFSRKPQIIEAQYAPQVMGENMPSLYNAILQGFHATMLCQFLALPEPVTLYAAQ
mgnify:CR=1 FL=1